MREALIKTVIRLVANATAKKILWGDNVPVANQISLDFPIVNSVIVHPLHGAMKKQVSFKKSKIVIGPIIYYVSTGLWDPPHWANFNKKVHKPPYWTLEVTRVKKKKQD
jgi:hypothetical protein